MLVEREDSGMYVTEPVVDGKAGGRLEENEWMGCTKVGMEFGSCDSVDLGVVADVDVDSDSIDG